MNQFKKTWITTVVCGALALSAVAQADMQEVEEIFGQAEAKAHAEPKPVKKKGLIKSLKAARKTYKVWKKENSNHKEMIAAIKQINKKIRTKGTDAYNAMARAAEHCKSDRGSCQSILRSNLSSIAATEFASIEPKKKWAVSLISPAYAGLNPSVTSCLTDDADVNLLILGGLPSCGITQVGPGLAFSQAAYGLVCSDGNTNGMNIGVFGKAIMGLGLSTGITLGANGVCSLIGFHFGVGLAAGLIFIDTMADSW